MKDPVWGHELPARLFKPFLCEKCRKVMGYYWDAEYENMPSVCLHSECFEEIRQEEYCAVISESG